MEYKTQEEYLLALAEAIKYLNPKDATKVLQYYQTRITTSIEYGEKEEDVIRKLPDVEQVAKETYESHGVNYLELRKIKLKRQKIVRGIISAIISVIVLISFFVIMFFIAKSFSNMFDVLAQTFKVGKGLDKFITPLAVLSYILVMLLLTIYIVDLFIIILSFFFNDFIKLKDENLQRKILSFTISGFIEEKTKHKKLQLLLIITFVSLTIICMATSYLTDGYMKHSLNNIPSNLQTINLDDKIKDININGYNGNIYFKQSETNSFYLEYMYEFEKTLDLKLENEILNISLEMTKSYDLLDLLTEPTQYLVFYIPNSYNINNINIKMDESIVDVTNVDFNNVLIETETYGKISFVNTNGSLIDVKGFNVLFALHSSNIKEDVNVNSSKGQTLIQKDCNLKNVNLTNGSGTINLESSNIDNLTIENSSGAIDVKNIKGNLLNLTSRTSKNNFTDIYFKKIDASMKLSGSLVFSRTYAENINITCSNSQLLFDYVKGNINIIGDTGTLYLSGVGNNYPNLECSYNSITCETNITSTNKGKTSKTEVVDSFINNGMLTQEYGYFMFTNNNVKVATINLANCDTADFKNLSGGICNLYLAKIETSLVIDADVLNDFKYIVKQTDTISFANMIRNEETTNLELENGESNE